MIRKTLAKLLRTGKTMRSSLHPIIAAGLLAAAALAIAADRLPPELEPVFSATAHDALFGMQIRGNEGLAVGDHGTVLRSNDSGATWTPVQVADTEAALLGVSMAGDRGLIVGQEGLVLRSDDRQSWERVDSGTDARLLNVALHSDGRAFIVGAFGLLLRSTDHGRSWEQLTLTFDDYIDEKGYEPHLYDVLFGADGRVFVAGEFGMIIASSDGGDTWVGINRGEESVFDMHLTPGGNGFAVGQNGLVLRTRDGGDTWERMDAPTESNLLGVWNSEFDEVVIAGIRALLRSSDNGETWRAGEQDMIIRSWFQGIASGSADFKMERGTVTQEVVYVAGAYGLVARVVE